MSNLKSYFSLQHDKIAFFEKNINDNNYHLVLKKDLMRFLIDTYIACQEVDNNPESYHMCEAMHQYTLDDYPKFSHYLTVYHIKTPDFVYPDQTYFPSSTEIECSCAILDEAWSELIDEPKDSLKKINELKKYYDFGLPNTVVLTFFDDDFITLISTDSLAQLVLYSTVYAIHENLQEPHFCIVCDKPFIPTKSNQIYCSARCKRADQKIKHPLQNKYDSRSHIIMKEIGTNERKYKIYESWRKEAKKLRDIYEPEVYREIYTVGRKNNHYQLTKKEFNDLKSVKEFTTKIKELWINLKKENSANGINQEN